ncbi:MAG: hypothetical protein OQL20_06410 [Sedimenticola sp.]|nr:hypothetical protein [Sedimenticola sp.]
MPHSGKNEKKKWARLSVSSLEADVAYFDARLAMLGQHKESYYQLAQYRAYSELERVLKEILGRLQARPVIKPTAATSSTEAVPGIEVCEESGSSPLNQVFAEAEDAARKQESEG